MCSFSTRLLTFFAWPEGSLPLHPWHRRGRAGHNQNDQNSIKVKPAVLVVPGCNAFEELEVVEFGNRQKLKALALDITYFTLELETNEITL